MGFMETFNGLSNKQKVVAGVGAAGIVLLIWQPWKSKTANVDTLYDYGGMDYGSGGGGGSSSGGGIAEEFQPVAPAPVIIPNPILPTMPAPVLPLTVRSVAPRSTTLAVSSDGTYVGLSSEGYTPVGNVSPDVVVNTRGQYTFTNVTPEERDAFISVNGVGPGIAAQPSDFSDYHKKSAAKVQAMSPKEREENNFSNTPGPTTSGSYYKGTTYDGKPVDDGSKAYKEYVKSGKKVAGSKFV